MSKVNAQNKRIDVRNKYVPALCIFFFDRSLHIPFMLRISVAHVSEVMQFPDFDMLWTSSAVKTVGLELQISQNFGEGPNIPRINVKLDIKGVACW